MSQNITKTFNFDNENNYSYNNAEIEFVSSKAKLLAQVGTPDAYAFWLIDTDNDLVIRDNSVNSRDLALIGFYEPSNKVAGGKVGGALQGIDSTSGVCSGSNTDYAFERTDAFSLVMWIKFTSTTTQIPISKSSNTTFTGYLINMTGGLFRWVVRDNVNVIAIETNSTYNDDNWHLVVVTYDGSLTESGMNLYVDNVLDKTTATSGTLANTIQTTADFQISGRDGRNNCILSSTFISAPAVYNRELTAAEVAFIWNNGNGTTEIPGPGTSFPTTNPTIIPIGLSQTTEFVDFDAAVIEPGSDEVRFFLYVDNVPYYWTGSAWAQSDLTFAQSSTVAEVKANITSFTLIKISSFNVVPLLHSNDGSTTPEIDLMSISYNFESETILLNETIVSSTLLELNGDPIPNETVKVRTFYTYGENITTTYDYIETTTLTSGFWQISIKIEDVEPDFLEWRIQNKVIKTNFVPGVIKFSDLTILEENRIF